MQPDISSDDDLPPVYIDFKQLSYCLRTMLQNDINGIGEDRIIAITARAAETAS